MAKKDYLSLEGLGTLVSEIKTYVTGLLSGKADTAHNHSDLYYTKSEIDGYEFITTDDIDTICGTTIQVVSASEVTF